MLEYHKTRFRDWHVDKRIAIGVNILKVKNVRRMYRRRNSLSLSLCIALSYLSGMTSWTGVKSRLTYQVTAAMQVFTEHYFFAGGHRCSGFLNSKVLNKLLLV